MLHNHEKKNRVIVKRNRRVAYLFLLPNMVGFLIFTFFPVLFAFVLSFTDWNGIGEIAFVGLENFIKLWKDSSFLISFRNTLIYTVGTVPVTMVFSIALAILMNKGIKGLPIFRAAYFFPYICSIVAISVVWQFLYHPTSGPVNRLLIALGIDNPPGWISSSRWALPAVMIISIWKNMGYYMIVYLAGLQGIPSTLYEAAKIDGAGRWKQIRYITLPLLTPTTFYASIMCMITSFQVFTTIYTMTQGGPGRATSVLVYLIYNEAFINFRFGYASSISFVLFLCIFVVTLIQFRGQKKWVNYMS